MTRQEDGAIEWDGLNLYRTDYTARRPLGTSLEVVNVLDFGAKGDGITDDSAAFQVAVDSLVDVGGILFVPPGRTYQIGSTVEIRSRYPIWMKSQMGNRVLPGGNGATHSASALIRPDTNLDYMFVWARPDGFDNFGSCGGGGVEGIAFGDWIMPQTFRTKSLSGAINIDEANYFTIRDSYFAWLKGRALRVGRCVIARVENSWIYQCGDTGKPAIDLDGSSLNTSIDHLITNATAKGSGPDPNLIRITAPSHGFSTGNVVSIAFVTGTTEANGIWTITVIDANTFDLAQSYPAGDPSSFQHTYVSGGKASLSGIYGALWGRSMGIEQCSYGAPWIKGTTNGHAWLMHCYFEDGGANDQSFVDQSAGGGLTADGCAFNRTHATAVKVGGEFSRVLDCTFSNGTTNTTPQITVSGQFCVLSNTTFTGGGQTGKSVDWSGTYGDISNCTFYSGGNVDVGANTKVSGCRFYACTTEESSCIKIAAACFVQGCVIDGSSGTTADGIEAGSATATVIVGNLIQNLDGGDGIVVPAGSTSVVGNNAILNLNGGTPIVYTYGMAARNNVGYTAIADDGDQDDVITLHAESALLTTKSLSTTPGSEYTLTWYNSLISANSRIEATIKNEGAGTPVVTSIYPTNSGFAWLSVKNIHPSASFDNVLRFAVTVQN
jgi:hypothetical protein